MAVSTLAAATGSNIDHWDERIDLACAFRWTARWNMHESVANHFSIAVSDDGCDFLVNPRVAISAGCGPANFCCPTPMIPA